MSTRVLFKVEKNRVLVPVGEPCPFGCRYCYTRGGEVGLSHKDKDEIIAQFRAFAQNATFETIQFGYDGDPFARPARGLAMLSELALMGKNLNFSTKALIEGSSLDALRNIRAKMEIQGTTLSALVSLSCWDSASVVEPHTPSPAERVRTVANLTAIGIPVFIAMRPVLPHIDDLEYLRIVIEGVRAGSEGFVVGPLYADARGRFVRFIPHHALESVPSELCTVSWSAHAPLWKRYEDLSRLHGLMQMIEQQVGRSFQSSADAMALVSQKEVVG